jgi:hypothetical protein
MISIQLEELIADLLENDKLPLTDAPTEQGEKY